MTLLAKIAVLCAIPLLTAAKVVKFTIVATWVDGAPNGVTRKMFKYNGTSPGPPLYMDFDDTVETPFNTSVHFHGIEQLGSPWADGVPGLSQKPIRPGATFLYKWRATEYGTYWYHSHSQSQIDDGATGPIFIRPPQSLLAPFASVINGSADAQAIIDAVWNPKLVVVSDWIPQTSEEYHKASINSGVDIYCVQSLLINGKGSVYCLGQDYYQSIAAPTTLALLNGSKIGDTGCSPPIKAAQGDYPQDPSKVPPGYFSGCKATKGPTEVFNVDQSKKWASFNFIGATGIHSPLISLDSHKMYIYAVDGHFIEPRLVNGFQMNNGERYAALVQLNQTPGTYTLRASNLGFAQIISAFANVTYQNPQPVQPVQYYSYSAQNTSASVVTLNNSDLRPYPAENPARYANSTHIYTITRTNASWAWALDNNVSYPIDFSAEQPLLYYPNSTNGRNSSLVIRTLNNTWVDIVFYVIPTRASPLQPPHPIHKHSNKGSIIGSGEGEWKWATVAEAMRAKPQNFNLDNPPYRDSFVTLPLANGPTWLVMRYWSKSPGAWAMHCHIQPHFSGGMAGAILDGIDKFPALPPPP